MDLAKESVYWVFRILIISIALVFIIIIPGSLTNAGISINNIQDYIIRNKIIMDEDCLAYSDYRIHLGIINKDKFTEINLNSCLNTEKGIILNLKYGSKSEMVLINKEMADKIDFCYDEKSFYCERKEYSLILKDGSEEVPAKLTMDIITLLK